MKNIKNLLNPNNIPITKREIDQWRLHELKLNMDFYRSRRIFNRKYQELIDSFLKKVSSYPYGTVTKISD